MKSQPNSEKVFIPVDLYQLIKRIENKLDHDNSNGSPPDEEGVFGKFISEEKAKERLGRKTTWFYYQRKNGKLKPYRLGSKVFYEISDLEKLIEDGAE